MTEKSSKTLFLTAAIFNWTVGLVLVFKAQLLFAMFRIVPAPAEPLFLLLFSGLVMVFGIGYFWSFTFFGSLELFFDKAWLFQSFERVK